MEELEKIIWLSVTLIVLITIKDRVKVALPILLLLAGLVLSQANLIPLIEIRPELIFYVVLPPILFDSAWNTSIPDFKKEFPKIGVLAVLLVFLTTTIVALFVHSVIPNFSWPLAFALGAIVSPPDAIAATSITKVISLPQKVITILEGESLLNDASALIAYKFAVVAVVSGVFSLYEAGLQFVLISCGGILVGLIIGFVFLKLYKFFHKESNVETFAIVLLPFLTYSFAEHLGCSGVLAVVILGLYLSWNSFSIFTVKSRLQMGHFWEVIIFALNGFVFLLLGMQLPQIILQIAKDQIFLLLGYSFVLFLILVIIRLSVLFLFSTCSAKYFSKEKGNQQQISKEYLILSWSGMRGVVSFAAALALPITNNQGMLIGDRNTVLFISFVVIVLTLLIQGITLPALVKLIKPLEQTTQDTSHLNDKLVDQSILFLEELYSTEMLSSDILDQMHAKLTREQKKNTNILQNGREDTQQRVCKKAYLTIELKLIDFQRNELEKYYRYGSFSLVEVRKKEGELDFWATTIENEIEQLNISK